MERKHLASIPYFSFPTFSLLSLPLPQLRCILLLLPSRGKTVSILVNLLFCCSVFSGICKDYRTLFLKNLIVLLFRTDFCRKCFMDIFVFSSTTAPKAVVIIVLLVGFICGRFLHWNPQKSLHLLTLFCHQPHKQPHTVPTRHSERSFVSFLLIPAIFLSFKSVPLLAGSKDPKPVTKCY